MRYPGYPLLVAVLGALQGCFFPVIAAGVGTGVLMATDRRTAGAYIEDEGIENKAISQIKLIAENGTVFLMGLVYRKEAEAATEIASTTGGVQRVVKVFEYLD